MTGQLPFFKGLDGRYYIAESELLAAFRRSQLEAARQVNRERTRRR